MSRSSQFEKFFVDKKNNAAVKEQFKQDKKKEKKERAAAIDKYYDEKRKQKAIAREQAAKPNAAPVRGTNASKKTGKQASPDQKVNQKEISNIESADLMPLNKYVAHSGVCARRDAAILVKEGKVSVNGKVITEPGFKVSEKDLVKVNDKKIVPSRNFVYILLNKPKDYITTNDDPQGRKTVLELVKHATTERVYPVGRLDRNTSGVLLLTNDGELAQKLSHPKHEIKKIYEVHLDKSLAKGDFDKIMSGLTLEDGFIVPDSMAYADPKDKTIIGIEIHSGRNRIVRRIFEHLNYDVRALDRVMYAGLTKKNVQRGKWRLLLEKEVRILKHFNKQKPV